MFPVAHRFGWFWCVAAQFGGIAQLVAKASIPGSVLLGAEPVANEEWEVGGVVVVLAADAVVVEQLTVVGVGPAVQQNLDGFDSRPVGIAG